MDLLLATILPMARFAWAESCRRNIEQEPPPDTDGGIALPHAQPDIIGKLGLRVGWTKATASVFDSDTARDFLTLLPLRLTFTDVFAREKAAHLPRRISDNGPKTRVCEAGDLVYWPPGPDVGIVYRTSEEPMPDPGVIVIGKLDSEIAKLLLPAPVRTTMRRLAHPVR
jgi:hypothetical protein